MIIINSSVITATEILEDYAVVISGDTIEKLLPMNEVNTEDYDNIINAKGGYVTAGFIDIHSDYIEG
ncbi:MAG: alpha-D-ribose 1-methylphosphonate 5-triphosphate diphosphatase, partial [Jeotgalicoccus sp.]|nr:alpha-D-ribose 1-methylphosphonate 5-triphosphate diphosphatase [Jeotgalicoccus sp.]